MPDTAVAVKYLKGVGEKKAELLAKFMEIDTVHDLLHHFPYRYVDRSRFFFIREIDNTEAYIQLKGKLSGFRLEGNPPRQRLIAMLDDETGRIELVWFQSAKWIMDKLKPGNEYVVFGKPNKYKNSYNLVHPDVEPAATFSTRLQHKLMPLYSIPEKLKKRYITSKVFHGWVETALKTYMDKITETLPPYMIDELHFVSEQEALRQIHFPENQEILQKARYRFKYQELFYIQLNLLKQKALRIEKSNGFVFKQVGDFFNTFYHKHLPFELTNAQKRVLREIRQNVLTGKQMNRLLQGDVGSGKTLVALMSMLLALDNGFQACLMAPTEILAQQHYQTITEMLGNMDISTGLLTGSTRAKARRLLHEQLQSGEMHLLIGTHALIEDTVKFKNLGLVIIDEQHRFGVAQRAKLWEKNSQPPHMIVMTATPIPRTLAMTVYGDLDISVIDELPAGRKPIQTSHAFDSQRLRIFAFLRKQIAQGRQIYVVYPLIKESEKMDYKDLEDGYESITRAFPPPQYAVSILHGQMKPEDKEISMRQFVDGRAHIMVATTVIEVGVNVPNASVMVIESAERFGLSQLHQLRGRVGRGASQSYCILMTSYKLSADSRKRMQTMVETNDGFKIAEVDMKLRGPGDLEGTQQSGIPFDLKLADLARDSNILQHARDYASLIIKEDPELNLEKNSILHRQIKRLYLKSRDWSRIS